MRRAEELAAEKQRRAQEEAQRMVAAERERQEKLAAFHKVGEGGGGGGQRDERTLTACDAVCRLCNSRRLTPPNPTSSSKASPPARGLTAHRAALARFELMLLCLCHNLSIAWEGLELSSAVFIVCSSLNPFRSVESCCEVQASERGQGVHKGKVL